MKAEGAVSALIAEGLTLRFHFTGDDLARALLLRRLIEAGLPIADFTVERERLQDAYLSHVGQTNALR